MDRDHFSLGEKQFARLEPHLPMDARQITYAHLLKSMSSIQDAH
jgi:hypothetical protein